MCAHQGGESEPPPAATVALRLGRPGDAAAVAALHSSLITEGFLSSLGAPFLERLYRRVPATAGSFLVVAEGDGVVVGFVAGSLDVGELYRQFALRDGPAVALRFGVRLARSWRRVLETLRHARADSDGGVGPADAELLAVAVSPDRRRSGLGAQLVQGLLDEATRHGAHSVDVVVGADNDAAVAMYRAAGFVERRRFELHAGTPSLVMRHGGEVPGAPAR